jgi:hypothetical protein
MVTGPDRLEIHIHVSLPAAATDRRKLRSVTVIATGLSSNSCVSQKVRRPLRPRRHPRQPTNRASDRLTAAGARIELLESEVNEARAQALGVVEAAAVTTQACEREAPRPKVTRG